MQFPNPDRPEDIPPPLRGRSSLPAPRSSALAIPHFSFPTSHFSYPGRSVISHPLDISFTRYLPMYRLFGRCLTSSTISHVWVVPTISRPLTGPVPRSPRRSCPSIGVPIVGQRPAASQHCRRLPQQIRGQANHLVLPTNSPCPTLHPLTHPPTHPPSHPPTDPPSHPLPVRAGPFIGRAPVYDCHYPEHLETH
jgi:hypothetical protein